MGYHDLADRGTGDLIASCFDPKGYTCVEHLDCSGMTVRMLEDDGHYYVVCLNRGDIELPLAVQIGGRILQARIPAADGDILTFDK